MYRKAQPLALQGQGNFCTISREGVCSQILVTTSQPDFIFNRNTNVGSMFKFSQKQIQNFEEARFQDSIRLISAEISRSNPELYDGSTDHGQHEKANHIAKFCADFLILRAENIRKITRTHLKFGTTVPEAHMTIPLRREGFSEDERTKAYLYALEEKKKRLVLRQSV